MNCPECGHAWDGGEAEAEAEAADDAVQSEFVRKA